MQIRARHGKFKIYIIDEVHMLSTAAFNALLKTLEEPPAHVKFMFATTDPEKVLPTILSRCQRFDLRRIPAALIVKHLKFIARRRKKSRSTTAPRKPSRAARTAACATPSPRSTSSSAFCGDKIEEPDVLSMFGFTSQQTVSNLCGQFFAAASAGSAGVRQGRAGGEKIFPPPPHPPHPLPT